jgi:hypothetical protein
MADRRRIERRGQPRTSGADARARGRTFEFIASGVIAATLATGGWFMAEQALARPLALVFSALG